jgi:hypothetical protein
MKRIKGSNRADVAMPEYVAPARSKNKPAYAHSFTRCKPGIRIIMAPNNLATLINFIKYTG